MYNNQKMIEVISYTELRESDFEFWLIMSSKLWQDYDVNELRDELRNVYNSPKQQTFIAKNSKQIPIGFINISIRNDYVEGSEKSPTGYLEAIFVDEKYRLLGVAKNLLKLGENWLKQNHCSQIGSDTWLTNIESQNFHKKMGFQEEERLVHFLKNIE